MVECLSAGVLVGEPELLAATKGRRRLRQVSDAFGLVQNK
jgi:hypothetical protein